ncbi:MAG: hypothetical protein DRJ11_03075 [Candidatus Aminicenantes bacterium]|nr:MAG: hypothetical protein DRJ11_03075 [Candidatus Aminicenantes bacterium]
MNTLFIYFLELWIYPPHLTPYGFNPQLNSSVFLLISSSPRRLFHQLQINRRTGGQKFLNIIEFSAPLVKPEPTNLISGVKAGKMVKQEAWFCQIYAFHLPSGEESN